MTRFWIALDDDDDDRRTVVLVLVTLTVCALVLRVAGMTGSSATTT